MMKMLHWPQLMRLHLLLLMLPCQLMSLGKLFSENNHRKIILRMKGGKHLSDVASFSLDNLK